MEQFLPCLWKKQNVFTKNADPEISASGHGRIRSCRGNTLWGWSDESINKQNTKTNKRTKYSYMKSLERREWETFCGQEYTGRGWEFYKMNVIFTVFNLRPNSAYNMPTATEKSWKNLRREMLERGFLNSASKISD